MRPIRSSIRNVRRALASVDRKLVDAYLVQGGLRKLHIGCGSNRLPGWLNSDYSPASSRVLRLDATKLFPLESSQFDYVFSEHMIEHISYPDGVRMLAESFRILRPGGKIRISTPDLQFLIGLYNREKSTLQDDYIAWATRTFVADAPVCDDTFVINNFVRAWGHRFIYDEKTLRRSLESVGFTGIATCNLNASTDAELRNLERETRMPDGFLQLESMTLEATKA